MITILEFMIIAVSTILVYAFIKTVVETIKSK
jgi:hypothetical protein